MNGHSSLKPWREPPRGAADHRGDGSKQEPKTPPFPRSVDDNSSKTITTQRRSPLKFFLLVFALSIPFALIGAVTGLQLFPGIPVVTLAFACPTMAAAILSYRENGTTAVAQLLRRSFDYQRIGAKIWFVPIILLMPGVYALTYELMRVMGFPLATPQLLVLAAVVLLLAFFIMALGEELGWMGYAIDPMQGRWNAFQAGILLGLVWAGWHSLAIVQDGQSPAFIAWAWLDMVGIRVLAVWLYNNTGKSVFAISLLHVTGNLKWILFPGGFSYDAQLIESLIVAVAAAIVTVVWGPRTLANPMCRF
jgi:membrane protease YdiL (CAAX protease family)